MPGVPSNKACERCKKRHLKCDEARPHCQRCTNAGVECPGYVQTRKFIDQGASVRRRYAPYQESHANSNKVSEMDKRPESASRHEQTPNHMLNPSTNQLHDTRNVQRENLNPQWRHSSLGVDDDIQMTEGSGPSNQPSMAGAYQSPVSRASTTWPNLASSRTFGLEESGGSSSSTVDSSASPSAAMGFNLAMQNTSNIDRAGHPQTVSSENVSQENEKEELRDIFSELVTGSEHEIAFLVRHYAEVLGPWLDLSDATRFFSVCVPVRAINCPSLKYAIAALAAKQLGRMKGIKHSERGGMLTRPATTETYPNPDQVDWFLKAANYYYLAASELKTSTLSGYTVISSSAVLQSPIEMVVRWQKSLADHTQNYDDSSLLRKLEDIVATATLLTFYRLLDSHGEEWHSHLMGIQPLYDFLLRTSPGGSTGFSNGIRACFWNFARQVYIGSYFTRSATHFDPHNLVLWRAAGIHIDYQGKFSISRSGSIRLSQEDQAVNGLCWLISKVINYLAHYKQSQLAQWTGSPQSNSSSHSQEMSAESSQATYPDTSTWIGLCFALQSWFEGVPETFRPCVRIEKPRDSTASPNGDKVSFPEIFHSLPTCAAGTQQYHFGRMALLLNRPTDAVSAPSTAFDRLQDYREVTKEVEHRCREICGIALGRPRGEVRIHMVPLLFAAGQCLESEEEHQVIVNLLRGVEADLGWETEYAVQKLQKSWNR